MNLRNLLLFQTQIFFFFFLFFFLIDSDCAKVTFLTLTILPADPEARTHMQPTFPFGKASQFHTLPQPQHGFNCRRPGRDSCTNVAGDVREKKRLGDSILAETVGQRELLQARSGRLIVYRSVCTPLSPRLFLFSFFLCRFGDGGGMKRRGGGGGGGSVGW